MIRVTTLKSATQAAHRQGRWAACLLVAALVAGCGGGTSPEVAGVTAPAPLVASGQAQPAAPAADAAGKVAAPARVASAEVDPAMPPGRPPLVNAPLPVRVQIPRLRIDAAMDPLHLDKAHVLVPPKYGRAGWYQAGPEPGELGRAVIAGHVDSKTGPDVFAALRGARRGDRVQIRLADRSMLTFVVYAVEVHPRDDFPTSRVYGAGGKRAELRLITCTGAYDRSRGGYQDNLVVFARLVK